MYHQLYQELGLSINEAKIFQKLLETGELSVAEIATSTKIHRRNVYDSLYRLMEKGLSIEIIQSKENLYQAVHPNKLAEIVEEKRQVIGQIMPELKLLYAQDVDQQNVLNYRGIEGWKSYMRDILRVGEDFYCMGGKGAWMDERLKNFFPRFIKEADRKGIKHFHFFDNEVKSSGHAILNYVGEYYKFLPPEFSSGSSIDCFGPHVNIVSNIQVGGMGEEISFTVIINQRLADSVRTFFRFMWDHYEYSVDGNPAEFSIKAS